MVKSPSKHEPPGRGRAGLGVRRGEAVQALAGCSRSAATPVITSGRCRPSSSRCRAAAAPPAWLVVPTDGNCGLVVAVVDQHHRQAAGVQGGDVVEGALRLDDQQAVERLGGDLGAELAHRLVAAVAGEQQQAVPLGLQHVDRALQHLAHPRPGERRDEHADDAGPAAGQADRPGAGHVAELLDHLADPGGGATRRARPCR